MSDREEPSIFVKDPKTGNFKEVSAELHFPPVDKNDIALWSGIRVWYPPFSADGKYYRTKFRKRIFKEKGGVVFGTVEMELVPEEEMTSTLREGWDWAGKGYHYFVEGRSLCRNWGFPNYENMAPDTGNTKMQSNDCKACFRALVKRRAKLGVAKIEGAKT